MRLYYLYTIYKSFFVLFFFWLAGLLVFDIDFDLRRLLFTFLSLALHLYLTIKFML